MPGQSRTRRSWPLILNHARQIMDASPFQFTLRQLFYRLVADGTLRNTRSEYTQLSSKTAEARREGTFPQFVDRTREIHQPPFFEDPNQAIMEVAGVYRLDCTEGQERQVILVVEKDTVAGLVQQWFRREGVPVVALRGYASQSLDADIDDLINRDSRPTTVIYAGDFDPSGEDIVRNFLHHAALDLDGDDEFVKVVVTPEIIERFNLPELAGKASDTRSVGFVQRHGRLVQVEVEALDPADLHDLLRAAVDPLIDESVLAAVIAREETEAEQIRSHMTLASEYPSLNDATVQLAKGLD